MLVNHPEVAGGEPAEEHLARLAILDQRVEERMQARPGGCRRDGRWHARVHRHAHVAPGGVVDRDGRHTPARGDLLGEGVEEGVGGAVVDLAEVAVDGDRRGAEDEEVERLAGQCLLEHAGAAELRREDRRRDLRVLELDDSPPGQAGGMHDPLDGAEALARGGHRGAHLLQVGDIGARHQYLGAELLEAAHGTDRAALRVLFLVLGEVLVPRCARWQGGAPGEHQTGAVADGERFGERQADAAEAAGDQVDAALDEWQPLRERAVEADRFPSLDETPRAAQRHGDIAPLVAELGEQAFEQIGALAFGRW